MAARAEPEILPLRIGIAGIVLGMFEVAELGQIVAPFGRRRGQVRVPVEGGQARRGPFAIMSGEEPGIEAAEAPDAALKDWRRQGQGGHRRQPRCLSKSESSLHPGHSPRPTRLSNDDLSRPLPVMVFVP